MKVRILIPALSIMAASMLATAGCNRESPKGGPGAKSNTTATNSAASFSIKVPPGSSNVTQGEQKEFEVSISRGGSFDQDVKLTFKAPEGVQVTPDSLTAKKGADDLKITVKAMEAATPGTTNIKVTGTPATGTATTVDMGIEIKKKS